MARYRISRDASAVAIELTEVGGQSEQLIDAFAECAEGRCSCPTAEYEKLASLDVRPGEDEIALRLESKPGTTFDTAEIANCLDHTIGKIEHPATGGIAGRTAQAVAVDDRLNWWHSALVLGRRR